MAMDPVIRQISRVLARIPRLFGPEAVTRREDFRFPIAPPAPDCRAQGNRFDPDPVLCQVDELRYRNFCDPESPLSFPLHETRRDESAESFAYGSSTDAIRKCQVGDPELPSRFQLAQQDFGP